MKTGSRHKITWWKCQNNGHRIFIWSTQNDRVDSFMQTPQNKASFQKAIL